MRVKGLRRGNATLVDRAVAAVLLGGCTALGTVGCRTPWDHSRVAELPIADPDLLMIADGACRGSFRASRCDRAVEVRVSYHRCEEIEVRKNKHGDRARAAEAALERAAAEQTLLVDVVSGATHSSKALLRAAENALHS